MYFKTPFVYESYRDFYKKHFKDGFILIKKDILTSYEDYVTFNITPHYSISAEGYTLDRFFNCGFFHIKTNTHKIMSNSKELNNLFWMLCEVPIIQAIALRKYTNTDEL